MAKGGSYEREIAKKLSLWFTDGKRDDLICRTDSSGGRASVRTKNKKITNKYLYGDLKHSDNACLSMFDKWSIELKTGYMVGKNTRWDILDILDSKQKEPIIIKFWEQCIRDADLSNREPILIFRRNGRTSCIMLTKEYVHELESLYGDNNQKSVVFTISDEEGNSKLLIVFNLDSFLEWINPTAVFNLNAEKGINWLLNATPLPNDRSDAPLPGERFKKG